MSNIVVDRWLIGQIRININGEYSVFKKQYTKNTLRSGNWSAGTINATLTDQVMKQVFVSTLGTGSILRLFTEDGVLIKSWNLGFDEGSPVQEIEFELTENGCGNGQIKFAELNIDVEENNYIEVDIDNNTVYKAFVIEKPSLSVGVIKLKGYYNRIKEVFLNVDDFTNKATYLSYDRYISTSIANRKLYISDILDGIDNVNYNESKTEIEEVGGTLVKNEEYSSVSDMLKELFNTYENPYYYGVDEEGDFFCKKYISSSIENYIYPNQFESASEEKSRNEVPNRYKVYKKACIGGSSPNYTYSDEPVYIGEVGNGGSYPIIDTEKRPIWKKVEVNKLLYSTSSIDTTARLGDPSPTENEALIYAYEVLKQQNIENKSVKIENIDNEIDVDINKKIQYNSEYEKKALDYEFDYDPADYTTSGDYKLFADGVIVTDTYNPPKKFYRMIGVGIWLKTELTQQDLTILISGEFTVTNVNVTTNSTNDNYFFIPHRDSIERIKIGNYDGSTNDIYLKKTVIICYGSDVFEDYIKNIRYKIDNSGLRKDIEIGQLFDNESKEFKELEKKLNNKEVI